MHAIHALRAVPAVHARHAVHSVHAMRARHAVHAMHAMRPMHARHAMRAMHAMPAVRAVHAVHAVHAGLRSSGALAGLLQGLLGGGVWFTYSGPLSRSSGPLAGAPLAARRPSRAQCLSSRISSGRAPEGPAPSSVTSSARTWMRGLRWSKWSGTQRQSEQSPPAALDIGGRAPARPRVLPIEWTPELGDHPEGSPPRCSDPSEPLEGALFPWVCAAHPRRRGSAHLPSNAAPPSGPDSEARGRLAVTALAP